MTEQQLKPAALTDEELAKLQKLEAEIGDNIVVVAYDLATGSYDLSQEPANLDQAKLEKLQQLETELKHVYLVALKKSK